VRNLYEVLVIWRGLKSIEDSLGTFTTIAEDVRTVTDKYVLAADDKLSKHWSKLQKRMTNRKI
jgi:hypothetical protein